MFLWGAGWSALKVLTYDLSVEIVTFWRFFFMTLSFIPIIIYLKKPLKVNKKSASFILSSSILNTAFMFMAYKGIALSYAGSGGVIITTLSPIATFLVVLLLTRKTFSLQQYFGLALGVLGGAILFELQNFDQFIDGANIYFLLCAFIWAGVTLLAQHSHQHIHPIHYSFYISILASLFTFIYAIDQDILLIFDQDIEFWIALLYLSIFGQAVATTIFFIASARLGSEKSSSYMFLVPFFAILTASLLLDEPLEFHIILGGIISMLSVYIINKKSVVK
jgi:drug/metabolite transporter (DMT)-like permease